VRERFPGRVEHHRARVGERVRRAHLPVQRVEAERGGLVERVGRSDEIADRVVTAGGDVPQRVGKTAPAFFGRELGRVVE
jgi:hypothetical protein